MTVATYKEPPRAASESVSSGHTQTVEEMDSYDPEVSGGRGRFFQLQPFEATAEPIEFGQADDPEEVTIGRGNDNIVTISDTKVSRRHAVVSRCGKSFLLKDVGSTNGTLVNGRTVDVHLLVSGDRVRIGNHVFKYLDTQDPENAYHVVVHGRILRDSLTGAFNKAYFEEALPRVTSAAKRGRTAWLIALDVDHFKGVNDTHGHPVGDEVLCEVVRRLTESLTMDAELMRVGGEEFAVLLTTAAVDDTAAVSLAESLRSTTCCRPFKTEAGGLEITISLGITKATGDVNTASFVRQADEALYEAKRAGRNRVCIA